MKKETARSGRLSKLWKLDDGKRREEKRREEQTVILGPFIDLDCLVMVVMTYVEVARYFNSEVALLIVLLSLRISNQ